MPPEPASALARLQGWMLAVCTAPGGVVEGAPLGLARYGLDAGAAVKASNRASVEARLGVYAQGYLGRLLEVLRAQFPVLRAMVGEQVFDLFAQGYVWSRPPSTYSLDTLGAAFPAYLQAARPASADVLDSLPAELARLEYAMVEVGRARGVEDSSGAGGLDPVGLLVGPDAVVRTPDTVRLLRLEFALDKAVEAAAQGLRPDVPEPGQAFHAVARSRYRMRVQVLSPERYAFLQACGPEGADVGVAAAAAAQSCGGDIDAIWSDLLLWLPLAADAGLIRRAMAPERACAVMTS